MTPDDDPSADLPASAADALTLKSLHTRFLLPFVVTGRGYAKMIAAGLPVEKE